MSGDTIQQWADTLGLALPGQASSPPAAQRPPAPSSPARRAPAPRVGKRRRLDTRGIRAVRAFAERYADRGQLGIGGMGQVRRVYDRTLERVVAMKIANDEVSRSPLLSQRFLREANITAGLQHPGVVTVYDRGHLPDGRAWYTMREITGRTLIPAIREFHRIAPDDDACLPALRRLVGHLARVCEAMAYAHGQAVIHRDLKPSNIMVGPFDEVLVLDWGIAMHRAGPGPDETWDEALDLLSITSSRHTMMGQVLGTPQYMAPEQADGDLERHGPPCDVFSLGAILYEVLTGRPPLVGEPGGILAHLTARTPIPHPAEVAPDRRAALPDELCALAMAALRLSPAERLPDAGALGQALRGWLDDAQRHARAGELIAAAHARRPLLDEQTARAAALRTRAAAALAALPPHADPALKAEAWALEDEAAELEIEATIGESQWLQLVQGALVEAPDSAEAHRLLADHHRAALERAEARRDRLESARAETLLRIHDRGRHTRFLTGIGALTLATSPPGAEARLYRYRERGRRLEPVFERILGRTPLRAVPLRTGSYLIELSAPGRATVRYPVSLDRGAHWTGVPPGGIVAEPVWLPPASHLDDDSVYVPAGWFWRGGDDDAADGLPRQRVWVDGFVIRRHPVTIAEYLGFLDALVDAGREAAAEAAVPRASLASGGQGRALFERGLDGRYRLPAGLLPHHPVTHIDWHAAMACAAWATDRTGRAWRLPDETEWEKAARGVDGRRLPWGDHPEAAWARTLTGADEPGLVTVDAYPADEGPYGVRGMAGNTRDWCINPWRPGGSTTRDGRLIVEPADPADDDFRAERGGMWSGVMRFCRLASRFADRPDRRFPALGMRLLSAVPRVEPGADGVTSPSR